MDQFVFENFVLASNCGIWVIILQKFCSENQNGSHAFNKYSSRMSEIFGIPKKNASLANVFDNSFLSFEKAWSNTFDNVIDAYDISYLISSKCFSIQRYFLINFGQPHSCNNTLIAQDFHKIVLNLDNITKCLVSIVDNEFANFVDVILLIISLILSADAEFGSHLYKSLHVFVMICLESQNVSIHFQLSLSFIEFYNGVLI